jgi:septal ring factor EnvC (AmiA/AmiB activator)
MKLSRREKILLILVVVLALGAVYYFYFLTPFTKEMTQIQSDIAQKQTEFSTLNMQNGQLKLLDKQIDDLKTQNKELLDKIPTGFDQADLLNFIYDLTKSKSDKTSYIFEQPVDYVKIDCQKATLTFNTNYGNLKEILNTLKTCRFNNRIVLMVATTKEQEAAKPSDNEGDGKSEDGEETADTGNPAYTLNVVLTVEFYNIKGDIPADKKYDFGNGSKGKSNLFS